MILFVLKMETWDQNSNFSPIFNISNNSKVYREPGFWNVLDLIPRCFWSWEINKTKVYKISQAPCIPIQYFRFLQISVTSKFVWPGKFLTLVIERDKCEDLTCDWSSDIQHVIGPQTQPAKSFNNQDQCEQWTILQRKWFEWCVS